MESVKDGIIKAVVVRPCAADWQYVHRNSDVLKLIDKTKNHFQERPIIIFLNDEKFGNDHWVYFSVEKQPILYYNIHFQITDTPSVEYFSGTDDKLINFELALEAAKQMNMVPMGYPEVSHAISEGLIELDNLSRPQKCEGIQILYNCRNHNDKC
jgi:hypothetical protein